MAKLLLLISSLLLSFSLWAEGFAGGDRYDITSLQGNVTVVCLSSGGQSTSFYFCRGDVVRPGPFQAFVHASGVNADEVSVSATRADGSLQEQTRRFDPETGRSRAFNLLVRTLFQRPLLLEGQNRLSYELKNRDRVVAVGQFDVEVVRDPVIKRCPPRTVFSSDGGLCRTQTLACDRYFSEVSNCQ